MIALGATKKYRSTHEHDAISFKSMLILYRKKGDRYTDKEEERRKKGRERGREEGNTLLRETLNWPFGIWRDSPVAQLVKNPPAMGGPGFYHWVGKIPWRREQLPTPVWETLNWPFGIWKCVYYFHLEISLKLWEKAKRATVNGYHNIKSEEKIRSALLSPHTCFDPIHFIFKFKVFTLYSSNIWCKYIYRIS